MNPRIKSFFVVVLLQLFSVIIFASENKNLQVTPPYFIVAYIETAEMEKFALLEAELLQSPQKVISVSYDYNTHELTVHYTELIRFDTLLQVIYRYFGEVEIVGGNYVK